MKIVSVECLEPSIERYDLEVEDYHNFVAQGVVVHNCNARYVFHDDTMHCGSRTEWKKEYPTYDHLTVEKLVEQGMDLAKAVAVIDGVKNRPVQKNLWWQALDATPALRAFCEANPGVVVYGEVYGAVQNLSYGHKKGEVSFAAFDLMKDGQWVDAEQALAMAREHNLPWVPLMSEAPIPFDFDKICEMAEGQSTVPGADHVREGVVVSPLKERRDDYAGRVKLKFVGAGYFTRQAEPEYTESESEPIWF